MLKTALKMSHTLAEEVILPGDVVVDATAGNGHDTVFLAQLVGETGKVIGFDIQEQAIKNTTERLEKEKLIDRVELIHASHHLLSSYCETADDIRVALFNLGYLPQGNKEIVTLPERTIEAITQLIPRLVKGGRILLVVYHGHTEGALERDAVLDYVKKLDQKIVSVASYQFLNQKNTPPLLIAIEKK